jgi:D-cysteine desulfhydrase
MLSDLDFKHLNAPIHRLYGLSDLLGVDLSVKRDDLIPYFLGGNKVRKNLSILKDHISEHGLPDVLVTNGGDESNHARVCALMASHLKMDCHLVLHGEELLYSLNNGNRFFFEASGAKIEYVQGDQIASTIDKIKNNYAIQGKRVLVVPGGAHSLAGARSYVSAVEELDFEPDYIVLASGTGATQAGLIAGVAKRNWCTKVLGISVARSKLRGVDAIWEIYSPLMRALELIPLKSDIDFIDDYVFGGYGQYSTNLLSDLKKLIATDGVPFDPVYTGKAVHGLIDMVNKNLIPKGAKVVFWHTGGLLNLESSRVV